LNAHAQNQPVPFSASRRRGLLLINLGTPDAPERGAVRRYLSEFLSDPRVIDIPALGRWLLVNLFILPTRPAKSAAAYRKVWTEQGSPLLVHSRALEAAVAQALADEYDVVLGMRYGRPSLEEALDSLARRGVTELTVFPLYPQYAASATGSSVARIFELLEANWNLPAVKFIPPFFDDAGFLDAFAEVARPVLREARPEHLLFSFHGLPERQVRKSDPSGSHCFSAESCCDAVGPQNAFCYRAQCFHTARELARRLEVSAETYSMGFQSRLGRTPWIRPYSDVLIPELARQGVKRLAVMCPAFVADCLETVEEVALRSRELFLSAGGESLTLVPSLNAHPAWVRAIVQLVRR
jgi:protoporphyrin/coproporphyrin ferrochelatase